MLSRCEVVEDLKHFSFSAVFF